MDYKCFRRSSQRWKLNAVSFLEPRRLDGNLTPERLSAPDFGSWLRLSRNCPTLGQLSQPKRQHVELRPGAWRAVVWPFANSFLISAPGTLTQTRQVEKPHGKRIPRRIAEANLFTTEGFIGLVTDAHGQARIQAAFNGHRSDLIYVSNLGCVCYIIKIARYKTMIFFSCNFPEDPQTL